MPGLVGRDDRVGEIEFSLVALSLRLREVRFIGLRCAFSASICRCAEINDAGSVFSVASC